MSQSYPHHSKPQSAAAAQEADRHKIKIHPLTLRPRSSSLPPALHESLTGALQQHGSVPELSSALDAALARSGYMESLDAYIDKLLQQGECGALEDPETGGRVLERVMEGVARLRASMVEGKGETGDLRARSKGGLDIPRAVVDGTLPSVRRELERFLLVVEDD